MFEIHVCENKILGLSILKWNEVLLTTLINSKNLFNLSSGLNKI